MENQEVLFRKNTSEKYFIKDKFNKIAKSEMAINI